MQRMNRSSGFRAVPVFVTAVRSRTNSCNVVTRIAELLDHGPARGGGNAGHGLGPSSHLHSLVWFEVGNGGMDVGDDYWVLYRDYYRDPFPHSLLSTRELCQKSRLTGNCASALGMPGTGTRAGAGSKNNNQDQKEI